MDTKEVILLKEVREFCLENIDNVIVNKKLFMPNKLGYACFFQLDEKTRKSIDAYSVRVYQTLGIDKKELASFQRLGSYTVSIYEEMLNLYGLSLHEKLDDGVYKKLVKMKSV